MGQHEAQFRFYGRLNDFLPAKKKQRRFLYRFHETPAVKDPIEAIGVPHTEVDLILLNGKSVGFYNRLQQGDDVSVYPEFHSIHLPEMTQLREAPHPKNSFVLDAHLGKLARMLRFSGADLIYKNLFDDSDIVRISVEENRIILTRDRRLLFRKEIQYGYCIRSNDPDDQFKEVVGHFGLQSLPTLYHRCSHCNGKITAIAKEKIINQLEPKTILYYNDFYRCDDCLHIYWKGSHYRKIEKHFENILNERK